MQTTIAKEKKSSPEKKKHVPIQPDFIQTRNVAIRCLEKGDEFFKEGHTERANDFYRQAWSLLRSL